MSLDSFPDLGMCPKTLLFFSFSVQKVVHGGTCHTHEPKRDSSAADQQDKGSRPGSSRALCPQPLLCVNLALHVPSHPPQTPRLWPDCV